MKALVVGDAVSEFLYSPEIAPACAGVELVLSCGDLPFEYLEYIVTVLDVPLLYVLGNHDRPMHRADDRLTRGPEGGRSIDGRVAEVRGRAGSRIRVAGFGGSGSYRGEENERSEREMRRLVRHVGARVRWDTWTSGTGLDVVVTHAAPRGIHDDADPCHRGFDAFLGAMRRHRPRYWLHGHVHPSYGVDLRPVRFEATEVRAVYGYEVLEIE